MLLATSTIQVLSGPDAPFLEGDRAPRIAGPVREAGPPTRKIFAARVPGIGFLHSGPDELLCVPTDHRLFDAGRCRLGRLLGVSHGAHGGLVRIPRSRDVW